MTRLRGLGIWQTAVMTMAAGFPQSVCACPGRPAKATESSNGQACPCGDGCCANAANARCCDGDRGPTSNDPSPHSGQAVCKKVLLAQHAQLLASASLVGPGGESVTWTVTTPNVSCHVPPAGVTASLWERPSHSPPTDLLLLLQHFLI